METHFDTMEKTLGEASRQKLLDDLKVLARDAEELLKATAGDVGEKARDARAHLTESLEGAKETVKQMEDRAAVAARAADRIVRDHPYEFMGVTFGLGLLLGVLINRK